MEAARGANGDSRFEGLHAEASAAVGYSANTLHEVRERYRAAYADTFARWQALREALSGIDREPRDQRPRLVVDGPSPRTDGDAEAGPGDAGLRELRVEVELLAAELD